MYFGLAYTRFAHTGEEGDTVGSPAMSQNYVFLFPALDVSGLVGYTEGRIMRLSRREEFALWLHSHCNKTEAPKSPVT